MKEIKKKKRKKERMKIFEKQTEVNGKKNRVL